MKPSSLTVIKWKYIIKGKDDDSDHLQVKEK